MVDLPLHYFNQTTSSNVSTGVDYKTALSGNLPKDLKEQIATPTDLRVPGVDLKPPTLLQSEVSTAPGQPGNTPDAQPGPTDMSQDAYRFGNFTGTSDDPLTDPRVLGDSDDRIASISIVAQTETDVANPEETLAGGVNLIQGYSRFFLQNVVEADSEKMQVVETFTSHYVFFYGKKPAVYRYSGSLLNDENFKWTHDLRFFYENFFRGTRSVELGAQAVLNYDDRVVTGFIMDMTMSQQADLDKGAQFSFNLLVIDVSHMNFSADVKSIIKAKQKELGDAAALIQQQLVAINKNVPAEQALIAAKVRNNLKQPSSIQKVGQKDPNFVPPSTQNPTNALSEFVKNPNFVGP